jgi:glycosyltransferase involved in cell wall biosynthesis
MKATLLIPIYNGETTLNEVFEGLEAQIDKELISAIILTDDKSTDSSPLLVEKYAERSSYNIKIIKHHVNMGLAATYNEALDLASTDHVILMHQDIYLEDNRSFSKLLTPFKDPQVVVTYPYFIYPHKVWIKDGFWQKVLFSRLVDKKIGKLNGKFDCIDKTKGVRFDSLTYRTAGEDFDFEVRIGKHGKTILAELEVVHLQSNEPNFPLSKLVRKEAQLAECYGVNLRRHLRETPMLDILLILVRPALIIGLFIPFLFINLISLTFLLLYCFIYSWGVFKRAYKDPRILLLPLVNFFNAGVYTVLLLRGFITGRQVL